MSAARRARAGVAAVLLCATACPPIATPGADAGPDDTDGGDVPDGGAPDLTRDPSCPTDVAWIGEVRGSIVDESGAPLADAVAQMCIRTHGGLFLCLQPQRSDADGAFSILVAENARCADRATLRVLLPQADRATIYCGVALSLTEPSLTLSDPFVLVETSPPVTRPDPGDDALERTLVFADGLEVDVTPAEMAFSTDVDRLAARALDASDAMPCLLDGAPAFAGLYAFSPEAELDDASFALRIPNAAALPEGASVELSILGGLSTSLADGTRVEEGVWRVFGTGTVVGDVIDVPTAQGIPSFNWLGYRAVP